MTVQKTTKVAQVTQTAGCCSTNVKNKIICLNIPCKADLVLLGIPLTLQIKCLSIASKRKLTNAEIQMISKRLGTLLSGLLGGGLGG
jgi:hypothetical protein